MTGEVLIDRREAVVTITLSNAGKRNAIDYAMYDALQTELERVRNDATVRVLVLRGGGGHFAGGTDIRELAAIESGADGVRYEAAMRQVQSALAALRIPIVAVVEGVCVGGGLVLAALSDIVIASPASRFGSPIAHTIGNTISATSIARLHALLGRRLATELLMTGRIIDADEALAAGFISRLVDDDSLQNEVQRTVERLAAAAPLTVASIKEFQARLDAAAGDVAVDDVFDRVYSSADFRNGVRSFIARQPPRFTGE